MQKYIRIIALPLLMLCLLSGCTIPILNISVTPAGQESADAKEGAGERAADDSGLIVNADEDLRIKALIGDYFSNLYSEPAEDYYIYSAAGKLPEKIKGFISKNTISMADGNREIGVHLPRFLEANGFVLIKYDLIRKKSSDGTEMPVIDADFAGAAGGKYLYYTKVNLYARCVNADMFEELYTINKADNTWTRISADPIEDDKTDTVRIEARYDVLITKEDGAYKLDAVTEAVTTNEAKTRLLLYNNDFVKCFPYLDCTLAEDGKTYVMEEDGRVYEEEKALIEGFFSGMKSSLNAENMKLMQTAWDRDAEEFASFLNMLPQSEGEGARKLTEMMDIKDDYKTKFGYGSMPLQLGMEMLVGEFIEMKIVPHPGYTKLRKIYSVSFEVPAIKESGMIQGDKRIYRYDYFITLSDVDDVLKISGIRLNEYNELGSASSL